MSRDPTPWQARWRRSPERVLALAFALGLGAACQEEPTTPSTAKPSPGEISALITDNVVASVAVVPDSQMVFIGDQFKITAKPKNAAGQVLDRSVLWSVLDPTIAKALDSLKPIMTFKALKVGSTSIKATVDGKSRSAKIVVRSTTGAKVVVTPAEATVAIGGTVKFVATGLTASGETAGVNVTWSATGGTISGTGVLTAGNTTGTYRVIATSRFGKSDTSTVTITAAVAPVTKVMLVPGSASVAVGGSTQFFAYGRTSAGDSVPVSVTYTATGGTVTGSGVYTAGSNTGTYRVIAKSAAGLADTSGVTITAGSIARVILLPDIAASRAGATTAFVASAVNTSGAKVLETMTYQATCGTVTSAGVFTAPLNNSGSCWVTASAAGKADTTEVHLLANLPGQGVPFGIFGLWSSAITIRTSGVAAFTASHGDVNSANIVQQIVAARAQGVRLVLAMTGGSHELYKTDGVFDLEKWEAAMDAYDTPAIRDAVAEAVADGTIVGNSVMDEPQQSDRDSGYRTKSWGPKGTMTKARVDGLCAYVKSIFPTLPVGVFHVPIIFEPDSSYRICEFLMSQYDYRKGEITSWRDAAVAMGQRDGISILFSMNILDGGKQDKDGVWDCANTGGLGTFSPNCSMTPEEIRDFGKVLGTSGCALTSWRYDATFLAKPENQAAISDVALTLARLPREPCRRSRPANAPPTAAFSSECTDLDCSFIDESTDGDGTVVKWSWDFGDGSSSTERHPSHSYSVEGSYPVTLVVTDDGNATGTLARTVMVLAPPTSPAGP